MVSNEIKETPADNLIEPAQAYEEDFDPKAMIRSDNN